MLDCLSLPQQQQISSCGFLVRSQKFYFCTVSKVQLIEVTCKSPYPQFIRKNVTNSWITIDIHMAMWQSTTVTITAICNYISGYSPMIITVSVANGLTVTLSQANRHCVRTVHNLQQGLLILQGSYVKSERCTENKLSWFIHLNHHSVDVYMYLHYM